MFLLKKIKKMFIKLGLAKNAKKEQLILNNQLK